MFTSFLENQRYALKTVAILFYENQICTENIDDDNQITYSLYALLAGLDLCHDPDSRNCAARQRALQIILDLADKSSKRNAIIL